jgi:hypothetical protein
LHFLFSKAKIALKGKKFQDAEDIKENVTTELQAVLLEVIAGCFQKLFQRFNKCIKIGRDYFEQK